MIKLPPKYYHENFEYLLRFITDKYGDLLNEAEWRFLRKYYTLPEDAQSLFIRLINRKGLFFKKNTIHYDEIENISQHFERLQERGFIEELNSEHHTFWLNELLRVLTKADLLNAFQVFAIRNAKREDIIAFVKDEFSATEIIENVKQNFDIVKVNFENEVSFLKFLFFGNRSMDMTEFVLRDLGLIHYYKQSDDDLVARFTTRKEAEDKWAVSELFLVFEEKKAEYDAYELYDWFQSFHSLQNEISAVALPSYQKLLLAIGKQLERLKAYDLAIPVYRTAAIPPSRERMVRSMAKAKFFEEAKSICKEMLESPLNVDEQYFAEYFLTTLAGKKNRKQTTEWLKNAEEITISSVYKHQVELGSLEYYLEQGFEGGFSENFPWRALFGLLFWDIIFDPSLVAFHHPFQRRPSDLYLPDFYEKRKDLVHARLESFESQEELLLYLWGTFQQNFGTANPFVVWEGNIFEMVRILTTRIALTALKEIMLTIAQNIVENSRGMPDILIWDDEQYELIEIKSPNDTLSNQQLFWLRFFKDLGVNAKVLRVYFEQ